jgi:ELWxxDGT repeat protein
MVPAAVLAAAVLCPAPVAADDAYYHMNQTATTDGWGCHGVELWKGDQLLKALPPSEPSTGDFRPCSDLLFQGDTVLSLDPFQEGYVFAWRRADNGSTLIYGSDGTVAGTQQIWKYGPYDRFGGFYPIDFTRVSNTIYISEHYAFGITRITATQGTRATTHVLKGKWPGAGWHTNDGVLPYYVTVDVWYGHTPIVYVAGDKQHGRELWMANDTTNKMVLDIRPGPKSSNIQGLENYPKNINGHGAYATFTANDGTGRARWISDGTLAHTYKLPS